MTSRECSECLTERDAGKREGFEVETADEDCIICGQPACEGHGKRYDTMTTAGWAHETCYNAPDMDRGAY